MPGPGRYHQKDIVGTKVFNSKMNQEASWSFCKVEDRFPSPPRTVKNPPVGLYSPKNNLTEDVISPRKAVAAMGKDARDI